MALISSLAVGKSRKSAGNVTYQHYYGKEVLKQKIEPRGNAKATTAQLASQSRQSNVSGIISMISPFVALSVVRDKNKSATATLLKRNKEMLYTVDFTWQGTLSTYTLLLSSFHGNGHTPHQNIGISETVTVANVSMHVITIKVYPRKAVKKAELVIFAQNGYKGATSMKTIDMDVSEDETGFELVSWDYFTAMGLTPDDDSQFLFCVRLDGKPVSASVFEASGLGALFVP